MRRVCTVYTHAHANVAPVGLLLNQSRYENKVFSCIFFILNKSFTGDSQEGACCPRAEGRAGGGDNAPLRRGPAADTAPHVARSGFTQLRRSRPLFSEVKWEASAASGSVSLSCCACVSSAGVQALSPDAGQPAPPPQAPHGSGRCRRGFRGAATSALTLWVRWPRAAGIAAARGRGPDRGGRGRGRSGRSGAAGRAVP